MLLDGKKNVVYENYLILLIKGIIHNITSNIHIILEKRLIKFKHSALNDNEMWKQILCVKLRCKKSSFAENYRYPSWKYNFSDCDWFTNIAYLMGKVKIKQLLLYGYNTPFHMMLLFCMACMTMISVGYLPQHN